MTVGFFAGPREQDPQTNRKEFCGGVNKNAHHPQIEGKKKVNPRKRRGMKKSRV